MEAKYDFTRKFRDQVLRCSSCGFCRARCPVFGLTKRPALNARGKMMLLKEVMDEAIDLDDELIDTLFQCTTCASCSEQCPSGVNVPEIIKQVRKDMVHIGSCHPAFVGMNKILQRHTNIYAEDEPEDFERQRNRKAEYVYFIGCVGSYREDVPTMATLDLLDRLEVDYTLIDEVCCSGVLEDIGYAINEELAHKNVERILATGAKTVITGCPYCSRTFNDRPQYDRLRDEGVNVIHISQFLKDFDLNVKTDKRVTYHDPCDLGRHCGIYEEPREIVRKIAPNYVEMRQNRADALCCGAGGGVRGAYAKNSIAMARLRLKEVEEVGADILLTDCNSCVHNLSNAKLRAQKFKIYTITQFINQLMGQERG
ncbi:MAG: (Fe-S)-binding protein [Deltaproteobacteria bacterium]|nr:MAG: (Fe-S)-binding protein [Deltaproteobacteria bacterium]